MNLFSRTFILPYLLWIPNVLGFTFRFICPKDGRWPHPHDCEKYYTCNGSVAAEFWCGHGMTYDIDHERCDLTKNIDCKHGERPNWNPPEGWFTASINERPFNTRTTVTTTMTMMNIIPATEILSSEETTLTTMFSTRLAQSRLLSFSSGTNLIENHQCRFEGNLADVDDCQSYFTCQNGWILRQHCPDKYLFDDDLHTCNDYRKVVCGNRPNHDQVNNPCLGQPNGWYAEMKNHCRSYYLCTEQRKTKMGECPEGSRWNGHRLRCDDPKYLSAPCGLRQNHGNALFGCRRSGSPGLQLIILGLISFILFIV